MSYTVVAECWSIFESALLVQARKLVEDIAKHQQSDPKDLWAKIRPTIKLGLIDMEVPEQPLCVDTCKREGSAILERCRAPCLIGFDHCPTHIARPTHEESAYEAVKRILNHEGVVYFVDTKGVARDKSGLAKGIVRDGILLEW